MRTLVRENIKNLKAYSSARDEFYGDAKVFLDANESPNGELNRYPDPYQRELKKLIAAEKNISEKNILLGNGSDEIIDLVIRTFCEPQKDKITILPPTYGMYKVCADINNVEIARINLTQNFELNTDEIVKNPTKILFICSPNNPTGNPFELNELEEIVSSYNGIVFIDEAYVDFCLEYSAVDLIKKYSNVIVSQTFSKARGMAGIRLGMCFASEEIITILNKVKPPYNVNQLTQNVALESFSNKENYLQKVNLIKSRRAALVTELNSKNFIKKVYKSESNFLLIKVSDAKMLYDYLLENGVVVRNRSNQVNCENCLRITIGTKSENELLINLLNKFES